MTHALPASARPAAKPRLRTFLFAATVLLPALLLLTGAGQARAFAGAGPQWYWLSPQPQGATLYDVDFADGLRGWAVGDCGTILFTRDGGLTWKKQSSGTRAYLEGVSFASVTTGLAVGDDGTVLRTTDGGAHWTKVSPGTGESLNDVCMGSSGRAWAVGEGLILTSTDGGRHWTQQTSPSAYDLYTVTAVDEDHAWIAGGNGVVLRTADAGVHWDAYTSGSSTDDFRALVFLDDGLHGWVSDNWGTVYASEDGGETWSDDSPGEWMQGVSGLATDGRRLWLSAAYGTIWSKALSGGSWIQETLPTTANLKGLAVRGPGEAVTVGDGGRIVATGDSGASWQQRTQGVEARLDDVLFVDAGRGWAVGAAQNQSDSAIYATTDGGATWTPQTTDDVNWWGGVDFVDATHGWVAGWAGAIYRTDDGGATWLPQMTAAWPDTSYAAVAATSDQVAWAVGSPPFSGPSATVNMRGTADGGTTWSPVDTGTTASLNDVFFTDAAHGWAAGTKGTMLAFYDGSWHAQDTKTTADLSSVFFADDLHGWSVGNNGAIVATSDGGSTWAPQQGAEGHILKDVFFVSSTRGWIVGQTGEMFSTSDGGAHWTDRGMMASSLTGAFTLDARHAWTVGNWGAVLGMDVVRPVVKATAPRRTQRRSARVRFRATDSQSGVARVQYRLGRGAWKTGTSVKVTRKGRTVVSYRATDVAGNTSVVRKVTVRVKR